PSLTVSPRCGLRPYPGYEARRPAPLHGERGAAERQALCSEPRFDAEGDRVGAVELDVVPVVVVIVRIRVDVGGVDQVEVDVAVEVHADAEAGVAAIHVLGPAVPAHV